MQVKVAANEPEVGERNATLHITYVDDWGKAHTTDFNIGRRRWEVPSKPKPFHLPRFAN